MTQVAIKETPVLPVSQPTTLLEAISRAAADPATDMDKMERLFAMHQQMVKQQAEVAFNGAMARAQANMIPIATNAENSHTKSRYAKLEAINREIVPIYTSEGLSISFDTGEAPAPGWMRTIAHVSHAEGHTRQYHLDLPPDGVGAHGNANKTGVQAAGSTSSYARRYLTNLIFNISTFDDNDGNHSKKMVEPDAEGKKLLEACGSIDALKKVWQGLTAEQRKSLNEVLKECKTKVAEADGGKV